MFFLQGLSGCVRINAITPNEELQAHRIAVHNVQSPEAQYLQDPTIASVIIIIGRVLAAIFISLPSGTRSSLIRSFSIAPENFSK